MLTRRSALSTIANVLKQNVARQGVRRDQHQIFENASAETVPQIASNSEVSDILVMLGRWISGRNVHG